MRPVLPAWISSINGTTGFSYSFATLITNLRLALTNKFTASLSPSLARLDNLTSSSTERSLYSSISKNT